MYMLVNIWYMGRSQSYLIIYVILVVFDEKIKNMKKKYYEIYQLLFINKSDLLKQNDTFSRNLDKYTKYIGGNIY